MPPGGCAALRGLGHLSCRAHRKVVAPLPHVGHEGGGGVLEAAGTGAAVRCGPKGGD